VIRPCARLPFSEGAWEDRVADVSLRKLYKSYGAVDVVHGVDLTIQHKEFIVLIGPSGCGKSTILRMIAGLEDITGGTITIGGTVVNELEPKERDTAMVFQDYALYPHMSVYENMAFGLRYRKLPAVEINTRVREAASILGLDTLLHRRPRQLSGGQRQRVAMGRAIVRNPKVFLFDEPLSNLDAKLRVQVRTEIKKLHERVATTIIYVTHDQVEAMTLADRIVVLKNGQIEQVGTPEDVYETPATVFVAGFIGAPTMNLMPGRLVSEGAGLSVRLSDAVVLPVPPEPGSRYERFLNQEIIVGLRPEHLAMASGPTSAPPIEIAADVVEPLGADTLVFFNLAGRELVARVPPGAARRRGDRLRLHPEVSRMHLFDPSTEARI
jgi:multiple sugar transport system ATP-binding protein